ncbi:MAG TPA: sugar phosphate isomerase/epimerase family protein [Candidatus Acidoferrum sp.]|nr:sugar phosphate isomerase/epimerase family protein [Candidatus Acidoferrum sp.]
MSSRSLTRRTFLKTSAAATVTLAAAPTPGLFAADGYGGNKIPIAVQLYSVRKECAADLPGTLAALAKMGYRGVEFADYFKREAKTLRQMLADNGLQCVGSHIRPYESLTGDQLEQTIEFNHELGNSRLIVPSLPAKYTRSITGWQQAADEFNALADRLKPHGMRTGYHNEGPEFKSLDGQVPWHVFMNRTKEAVIVQLDTTHAAAFGADPVACLKKHPGRCASIHLQPFSQTKPSAIIGDDDLAWKGIFAVCETTGGTEWYIIEYEGDLYPPLTAVEKSLAVLRRWGKC